MDSLNRFKNRMQAGELLGQRLLAHAGRADVLVLALPRGGVPVGFVVAKALRAPLDVLLVRKLGMPGHEEYAIGAVAGGICVLQSDVISAYGIPAEVIEALTRREQHEIERREQLYRAGRPALQLQDKVVILVDDGLATGSTMLAAARVARAANPAHLIVAVPVGSIEACEMLQTEVDEVICLSTPEPFYAVGQWYAHFEQTGDDEVIGLLAEAEQDRARRSL